MSGPTYIGKNVRDRVTAVVRHVEGQPIFRNEQRNRSAVITTIGVAEGITTSTITAASVAAGVITYGQGTVQIVTDDPAHAGKSMNDPLYPSAVTVYSISTTTGGVPSGTNVVIGWRNGRWTLITVDCAN